MSPRRKKTARSGKEEIVSQFFRLLRDEYIVVENDRIPFWKAGVLFGVFLGAVLAISFLVSRSGNLQQSSASSVPIGFHDDNNDPDDPSDTAQCQIR